MRISQDDNSWKASGVKRRDFSHTHNGPDVAPSGKSKYKDTKRWCRGKVGREHVWVPNEKYARYEHTSFWHVFSLAVKCENCGKERWGG
jgi:hypothetical protein